MLHRYHHANNMGNHILGEPTSLPSVVREDLLMLAPLNPYHLYATWYISYVTQNRLRDYIGEDAFDECRLILTLKLLDPDLPDQSYDISGPVNSCYISFGNLIGRRDSRGQLIDDTTLYGELCFELNNTSYCVTRSELLTLPRLHLSECYDKAYPPQEDLYDRILDMLHPNHQHRSEPINMVWLSEQLDRQLGVQTPLIGDQPPTYSSTATPISE